MPRGCNRPSRSGWGGPRAVPGALRQRLALRREAEQHLQHGGEAAARRHVQDARGIARRRPSSCSAYLAAGREGLGIVPSQEDVVFERFFDEAGGMQLVVHAPFGGRVNKGLGLALRKRFCATFDFELQAGGQ